MQHKVKATYLRLPCYKQISALSISLFLMIKQSQIPYFPGFPDSLKLIFNVSGSPLFELVDVFTTAIATSLIFWFVFNYLPDQKNKKHAMLHCAGYIENIYSLLDELFSFIMLSYSLDKSIDNCHIEEIDEIVFCRKTIYYRDETAPEGVEAVSEFILLNECLRIIPRVMEIIQTIDCSSYCACLDDRLLHYFDLIKENELVNNLNRYKRLSQQSLQAFSFHIPFDFISSLYVAKKQLGAVLTSPPLAHQYKLATEAEKEKRLSENMSYEKELKDQNKLDAVSEVVEVFRY